MPKRRWPNSSKNCHCFSSVSVQSLSHAPHPHLYICSNREMRGSSWWVQRSLVPEQVLGSTIKVSWISPVTLLVMGTVLPWKYISIGTSLVVQGLRLCAFNERGASSIPTWGNNLHAKKKKFFFKGKAYWHFENQVFLMQHKADYGLFVSLNIKDMYASLVWLNGPRKD